jgi:hypothetical protein
LNSRQNILLRKEMDLKCNVPKDHVGIFRETLRKHGCKVSYYYNATESGCLPCKTETKWHENISNATELVLTRSSTRKSLRRGLEPMQKKKLNYQKHAGSRHQKHWHHSMKLLLAPF